MNDKFEKHDAYSRYLSIADDKVVYGKVTPSDYITSIKLKRAVKTLLDEEIENLFNKEMSKKSIFLRRERLIAKTKNLETWQLNHALHLLYTEGNTIAFAFILKCKKTDTPISTGK